MTFDWPPIFPSQSDISKDVLGYSIFNKLVDADVDKFEGYRGKECRLFMIYVDPKMKKKLVLFG